MKKKLFLICFLALCNLTLKVNSQVFIFYGDKTFGGNGNDLGNNIINLGNNEFYLCGSSTTDVNGDKTDPECDSSINGADDVWLLKIDTSFNVLWNKSIGGATDESNLRTIVSGNNKLFVFSCVSRSDSSCEKSEPNRDTATQNKHLDYWVCAVDTGGNKIWDKTLGGIDDDDFPSITQLTTGDFIVCGHSVSPVSGDKTVPNYIGGNSGDYWCIKLDSSGNKLWDKIYGGLGNEYSGLGYSWLLSCTNGEFILGGSTGSDSSGDISQQRKGIRDIWIVKLDSAGNKIWDRRYGGSGINDFRGIISTTDNGYIVCGLTNSPQDYDVSDTSRGGADVWIIKLDSLGLKQWDHRYGGSKNDSPEKIVKVSDGYLICAFINSDSSGEVTENSYGAYDYWIFKIDSVGNKLWDKRFGGPGYDVPYDFIVMPDSSVFLFGLAQPGISVTKTDSGKGFEDYWLVHFKYVDTISAGVGVNEYEKENYFSVYPNPTQDKFKVSGLKLKAKEIRMYDLAGRDVNQLETLNFKPQTEVDVSSLARGLYFVQVKTQRGVYTQKVIKE